MTGRCPIFASPRVLASSVHPKTLLPPKFAAAQTLAVADIRKLYLAGENRYFGQKRCSSRLLPLLCPPIRKAGGNRFFYTPDSEAVITNLPHPHPLVKQNIPLPRYKYPAHSLPHILRAYKPAPANPGGTDLPYGGFLTGSYPPPATHRLPR